jgi:hypothetical protein
MWIMQAVAAGDAHEADGQADSAQSTGKVNQRSPRWTRRYRLPTMTN